VDDLVISLVGQGLEGDDEACRAGDVVTGVRVRLRGAEQLGGLLAGNHVDEVDAGEGDAEHQQREAACRWRPSRPRSGTGYIESTRIYLHLANDWLAQQYAAAVNEIDASLYGTEDAPATVVAGRSSLSGNRPESRRTPHRCRRTPLASRRKGLDHDSDSDRQETVVGLSHRCAGDRFGADDDGAGQRDHHQHELRGNQLAVIRDLLLQNHQ
jgi:hypothetical protein